MRVARAFAVAAVLLSSSAFAAQQDWIEHVDREERFTINIPAPPAASTGTFRSASGRMLPTRVFTSQYGGGTYSVTVVRYNGVAAAEQAASLDHAVQAIKTRGGQVTSEANATFEGMDSRMLQLTNPDRSRSFITVTVPPAVSKLERLYIVEGRVPAGAPVPGRFQQSLSFIDADGVRLRYDEDVDGNPFRIIGDTCGFPYTRKGEKGIVICDY
jgi:hypothetical protein